MDQPDFNNGFLKDRNRAPDWQFRLILLKRFDPLIMLEFAGGMKSIRSALLNLVELGPGTR